MNPDLGVGLAKYLFDDIQTLQLSDIKTNITNQLKKYLQDIVLIDAEFLATKESQDRNTAYLTITYAVRAIGVEDQVLLQVNPYSQAIEAVLKFMGGAENAVKISPEIFRGLSYINKFSFD